MKRRILFTGLYGVSLALLLQFSGTATVQGQQRLKGNELQQLAEKHAKASLDDFYAFLAIPNDAHYPENIEKNIVWSEKAFRERRFTTKRLKTATQPVLLAERKSRGASKTVLMYLHIDGQPVRPELWEQESPWLPVLKEKDTNGKWQQIPWEKLQAGTDRDWRIFARSASDDKGPAMGLLAALDAAAEAGIEPTFNIKVLLDFEEETGSPSLPEAVVKYKNELAADRILIFDGPMHESNQPTLAFGARGIADVKLTTYGPSVPQHSGHFGNYAPNPAFRLAQLLASMKDEQGRVLIPDWYEGIELSDKELAVLKAVPEEEEKLQRRLGIASADSVGSFYQEALQYPSLNIHGMASAWVGKEARTIVPATATAELDIRLVPESDPETLIKLLKEHIRKQGYYITETEPSEEERLKYPKIVSMQSSISYEAFRTAIDSETGQWLSQALTRAYGEEPVKIRIMGGSLPMAPFVTTLNIPAVVVPLVNSDNNQHSPNENIRLGNYIDGVRTILALLSEK
jgi:acetylornithine deacetylase/succinyl-diaminopimelate desuccinylase-like protein